MSTTKNEKQEQTESYNAAVLAFEEALTAMLEPEEAGEAITSFRELLAFTRAMARKADPKFKAIITYGDRKATFGPTTGRDAAASLARAWMESHAGVTSRGAPVTEVEVVEVDE